MANSLLCLGLSEYNDALAQAGFESVDALCNLDDDEWKLMVTHVNLKIGHAMQLSKALNRMKLVHPAVAPPEYTEEEKLPS